MAPSPEYDKEPKAPDKTTTIIPCEDTKVQHNSVSDQQTNSDNKTATTSANTETENNKDVETLDDGQLRALLDEAITYKCPKDREGKSSLFKELLEEVEQDEQACEAAARSLGGCRGSKRGGRSRHALPHSNSLQNLVAALAAEPTRRHHARHAAPAPTPSSSVSARAIHGGSLPSGVDTSSLLSEEPARGAGYLATVRCVNPPPLAERRVSASDANAPHEMELLNRRSKPMFPMTYTARATLEIGSGSVSSGRAVTTTTASNQVRTPPSTLTRKLDNRDNRNTQYETDTRRPQPERFPSPAASKPTHTNYRNVHTDQTLLMSALRPKSKHAPARETDRGGGGVEDHRSDLYMFHDRDAPRGPNESTDYCDSRRDAMSLRSYSNNLRKKGKVGVDWNLYIWLNNVDQWYQGLVAYPNPVDLLNRSYFNSSRGHLKETDLGIIRKSECQREISSRINSIPNYSSYSIDSNENINCDSSGKHNSVSLYKSRKTQSVYTEDVKDAKNKNKQAKKWKSTYAYDDNINTDTVRKQDRARVGPSLVVPSISSINPKNIRKMTIGETPAIYDKLDDKISNSVCTNSDRNAYINVPLVNSKYSNKQMKNKKDASHSAITYNHFETATNKSVTSENVDQILSYLSKNKEDETKSKEKIGMFETKVNMVYNRDDEIVSEDEIELIDIPPTTNDTTNSFSEYIADQQKLFQALQASNIANLGENTYSIIEIDKTKDVDSSDIVTDLKRIVYNNPDHEIDGAVCNEKVVENGEVKCRRCSGEITNRPRIDCADSSKSLAQYDKNVGETISSKRYILAELPNNAYIVLTLSKRLLTPLGSSDIQHTVQIEEIEGNNSDSIYVPDNGVRPKTKKKKEKTITNSAGTNKKKDTINKNALKALLFDNLLKNDRSDKQISAKPETTSYTNNEVDSAIPFSCITTPEVVASCNTTSSSASHSAVAVDPKPLQLGSCYRAVASLTGGPDEPEGRSAPASALATAPAAAPELPTAPPAQPATAPATDSTPPEQPRSVISSSFNGLPLSRPNYGSTGTTASDDYKKSLDENGNAVQGFSSPLSGSGQQKKPRRKKSSKNETVIDCRQIDGYQGDKDVNELLRFIESNAESARGPKLPRTKHRDDTDDKAGKKRSSERRKDKDKVKRASSLEELSRTTLEELTGPQPELAPAKPERRSWGDTRDAPAHPPPAAPHPVALVADAPEPTTEHTDFQTVTKKRKQRRRTDEPAPRRSRVPSPPSPPSPRAAHASDRSNDSNDDLDSVHSLPPAPSSAAAHASYADIARTRHNIPDLIESCNFYAEGEGEPEAENETPRVPEPPPLPPPADSEGYPALETRVPAGAKRARDLVKQTATNVRRDRKDRPPQAETRAVECPAPDVVADRRPPVILLDAESRPRDMDGVTFGFDINEQLLGGAGRRPRCDLVCDALAGGGAVPVRAGCGALRYVAPDSPADTRHLHQIIEYVGAAWDDVIRCGSGKVRYFSE